MIFQGNLTSTLHTKCTAGNPVLHADSFHPTPLKNSNPHGQYLRLRRNRSNETLIKIEAGKLQTRLLDRGYSRRCLRKACNRTIRQTRETLLFRPQTKNSKKNDLTRIIMRFSVQHKQIYNIIKRHWSILTDDDRVKHFIPPVPSVTFKRASSLKDKLVKSEYHKTNKKHCSVYGTFPCGHCAHCPLIRKEKVFTLPNGQVFRPKHFVNCQTCGVVYLMTCECGAFYVGKTQDFGVEHLSVSIAWR